MPLFYSNVRNSSKNNLYSHTPSLTEQPSFSNMITAASTASAGDYRKLKMEKNEIIQETVSPAISSSGNNNSSGSSGPSIIANEVATHRHQVIMKRLEKLENLLMLLLVVLTLVVLKLYN